MRSVFIIFVLLVLYGCASKTHSSSLTTSPEPLAQAVETARPAAVVSTTKTLTQNTAQFEYRIEIAVDGETKDKFEDYYRKDQLILRKRLDSSVYGIIFNGERVCTIVAGKPDSPRVLTQSNVDCSIYIQQMDASTSRLQIIEARSNYIEAYLLTKNAVVPVFAEEYLNLLAENNGADALFKSLKLQTDKKPQQDSAK